MDLEIVKKMLFKAYSIKSKILRRLIRKSIIKIEGSELTSKTIRGIYSVYYNIEIGMYSYGGCFNFYNIPPGTSFGRYGSFASFIKISRNHPIDYISTHPFFFNASLRYVTNNSKSTIKPLTVGHDVWIGRNAIILPKVNKIETGAVIGAGTILTKNVPPYAIVTGNPGKIVKYRFSKNKIEELLNLKWWEKSIEEIIQNIKYFTTPYK